MFIIKKIVAPLLFPPSLILLFLLGGMYLLWFSKRQKAGRIVISIGACLYALFSYNLPSDLLIRPLERYYSPYDSNRDSSASPKYVVVLGGGATSDPDLPLTSQLNMLAIVRLVEGISIYKNNPGSRLILSGGKVFNTRSEGDIMADIAENIGINRDDMIIDAESRDTREQALIIKKIVGNDQFVLVTSASHMPRSMALFKKQGMDPIPAPTMHHYRKAQKLKPNAFYPHANALLKAERAFYEYIGLVWSKLRGII